MAPDPISLWARVRILGLLPVLAISKQGRSKQRFWQGSLGKRNAVLVIGQGKPSQVSRRFLRLTHPASVVCCGAVLAKRKTKTGSKAWAAPVRGRFPACGRSSDYTQHVSSDSSMARGMAFCSL